MRFCPRCATPVRGSSPAGRTCSTCGASLPAAVVRAPMAKDGVGLMGGSRQALAIFPVLVGLIVLGAVLAWQRAERVGASRDYASAEAALIEGRGGEALAAFGRAGNFSDARARHDAIAAQVAATLAVAESAAAEGRLTEAIAILRPLSAAFPEHRAVSLALDQRVARRRTELESAERLGERSGEWLAVERSLAERLTFDPDDPLLAERLRAVRTTRSPLVYARDDVLFLAAPDGSDERMVTDAVPAAWPAWDPARRLIAFLSPSTDAGRYGASLYVVAPDGSGLRLLADDVLRSRIPNWSPDGTRLAYTSVAAFDRDGAGGGSITTRVLDLATGVEDDLTSGLTDYAGAVAWAPAGDRVAVVARPFVDSATGSLDLGPSEIWVIDLATTGISDVTRGRLPTSWRLVWDSSGTGLLVLTLTEDASSMSFETTALYRLDLETDEIAPIEEQATDVSLPVWSPDGTRAAFIVDYRTLRVRSSDGTTWERRLDEAFGEALTWSPDGSLLLLPAAESSRSSVVVASDGSGEPTPVPLRFSTDWSNGGSPQWSSRTYGTVPPDAFGTVSVAPIPIGPPIPGGTPAPGGTPG